MTSVVIWRYRENKLNKMNLSFKGGGGAPLGGRAFCHHGNTRAVTQNMRNNVTAIIYLKK